MGRKEKSHLRKEIRARLARLTPAQRRRKSVAIVKRLLRDRQYRDARIVFCYVSKWEEVDTWALLKKILRDKKQLFVPKHAVGKEHFYAQRISSFPRGLKEGKYGVLEPAGKGKKALSPNRFDLLIIPGLAFDRKGGRLGRGKGGFDRFLARHGNLPHRVALAFECQLVPLLTLHKHDQSVGRVITEKRIL